VQYRHARVIAVQASAGPRARYVDLRAAAGRHSGQQAGTVRIWQTTPVADTRPVVVAAGARCRRGTGTDRRLPPARTRPTPCV